MSQYTFMPDQKRIRPTYPRNYYEVYCPECGKLIFKAENHASGYILGYCRKCRCQREILLFAEHGEPEVIA